MIPQLARTWKVRRLPNREAPSAPHAAEGRDVRAHQLSRLTSGLGHRLPVVLGLAAGATLCGMRGYKAISNWAKALGQKARARFGCWREQGRYVVPSELVIRDCLVRSDPDALDRALQVWNQAWGTPDDARALDGKTMKNAIDEAGQQAHIMSVVGHDSKICHAQKKSAPYP